MKELVKEFVDGGYKEYTEFKYFLAVDEKEEEKWNDAFNLWLAVEKRIFERVNFWEEFEK